MSGNIGQYRAGVVEPVERPSRMPQRTSPYARISSHEELFKTWESYLGAFLLATKWKRLPCLRLCGIICIINATTAKSNKEW